MNRILAVFAAVLAFAAPVSAEPIRIIVPFAAGGPADMLARIVAHELQTHLATEVVVDNRGGAGGIIGFEAAARSTPDGKTLLVGSMGSQVISPVLRPNLSFNAETALEPIALIGSVPSVMIIRPGLGITSLADLIAKAKQGQNFSYGSAGVGSTMQIAAELLNVGAGIKIAHVPYRGAGPAINDLLGAHLDIIIADFPVLLPQIQARNAIALAMFAKQRSPMLPDVPTTAELGYPDMLMDNWYGLMAPAGVPADLKAKIEHAALDGLHAVAVVDRLKTAGVSGTLDAKGFQARLDADFAYWRGAIKKTGITVE
jgi:tripartite-type tricarboxylate transporter receptor subunit TctC